MRTQTLTILICVLGSLLAGCQIAQWQPGGAPHTASDGSFVVHVPGNWMFLESAPGRIVATHDGVFLQRLSVGRHELKEPLSYSKRMLSAGLTPFEVAEAVADDLRADHDMLGLEVTENNPVVLDGHPGFSLVVNYHTADNLRVSMQIVGAIVGPSLYTLVYGGPARYYFERDRALFQEVVESFRITGT